MTGFCISNHWTKHLQINLPISHFSIYYYIPTLGTLWECHRCLKKLKSSHISISYPGMKGLLNFSFLSLQLYATLSSGFWPRFSKYGRSYWLEMNYSCALHMPSGLSVSFLSQLCALTLSWISVTFSFSLVLLHSYHRMKGNMECFNAPVSITNQPGSLIYISSSAPVQLWVCVSPSQPLCNCMEQANPKISKNFNTNVSHFLGAAWCPQNYP